MTRSRCSGSNSAVQGVLAHLSEDHLKELGLTKVGDRAAFREAVVQLGLSPSRVEVSRSTQHKIEAWLGTVSEGLERYAALFLDEGFDTPNALALLEMDDMLEMGVKRGHARILHKAVAALDGVAPSWEQLGVIAPPQPPAAAPAAAAAVEAKPKKALDYSTIEAVLEMHEQMIGSMFAAVRSPLQHSTAVGCMVTAAGDWQKY